MAVDREKVLQAAQKYVDRKKYARAISEYQKLIVGNPNDARTLLKIGDLQARTQAYAEAVATYDRVGQYYSNQGFALKAVAVYKQIRELLEKYVPELTERYAHVIPKLAEIHAELGLLSEALAAYEEVIARAQASGRDREELEVLRKMAELDSNNPLRYIRFAEACCRLQELDAAIESFGAAAELLIGAGHHDDALKVLERLLHFRQEPRFARLAAEHYLERGSLQDGLLALAKLQICFQADPHDLSTLELLARVFTTIDQEPKAIEVRKEMARIAFEQGNHEVHRTLVDALLEAAPHDPQVQALTKLHVGGPRSSVPPGPRSSVPPASLSEDIEELDLADVSLEDADVSEISVTSIIEGVGQDLVARAEIDHTGSQPLHDLGEIDPHSQVIEEIGYAEATDVHKHTERALADAQKFRDLKLFSKAIEALRIAVEIDPRSIGLHQHLIEILAESGDREGTIQEMLALSGLYIDNDESALAHAVLNRVLEAEPGHPEALQLLSEIDDDAGEALELPHYDGASSQSSSVDTEIIPDSKPSKVAPKNARAEQAEPKSGLVASRPPPADSVEALESALEEAEFYASCGLDDDAKTILRDLRTRFPKHPLLLERLAELGVVADETEARAVEGAQPKLADKTAPRPKRDVVEPKAPRLEIEETGLGETDGATHYELGVAYKEMGLSEEALTELGQAARDPAHECKSYLMIGQIQRELGALSKASDAYLKGLAAEGKTAEQETNLYFELGVVYEMAGNKEEALYHFKKVARRDAEYRDVQKRIQALEPSPGKARPVARAINEDDEFDKAFDDMFKD